MCGKVASTHCSFFRGKGESQKRVSTEVYSSLLFRLFSVSFFQGEDENQKRVAMGVAMGGVESSAFSSLLRLFFQGKNESQKRVAASAHSSFLFLHSFVSFLRRKKRRKGKLKGGELPFRRFCLFFLKREKENQKRRTKSRAVAEEYRQMPFRCFSLSFLSF